MYRKKKDYEHFLGLNIPQIFHQQRVYHYYLTEINKHQHYKRKNAYKKWDKELSSKTKYRKNNIARL